MVLRVRYNYSQVIGCVCVCGVWDRGAVVSMEFSAMWFLLLKCAIVCVLEQYICVCSIAENE